MKFYSNGWNKWNIEIYSENYSEKRPFFIEFITFADAKPIQVRLFKAQYFADYSHEIHPWNLNLYGEVEKQGIISFWTLDFLKFTVDALNDKYENQTRS